MKKKTIKFLKKDLLFKMIIIVLFGLHIMVLLQNDVIYLNNDQNYKIDTVSHNDSVNNDIIDEDKNILFYDVGLLFSLNNWIINSILL